MAGVGEKGGVCCLPVENAGMPEWCHTTIHRVIGIGIANNRTSSLTRHKSERNKP